KEHGMQDVIYAILTYENGAIACLEACWALPENSPTSIDDKLELVGTNGVAYVDSSDNGVRFVGDKRIEYPDSRHWYYTNGQVSGALADQVVAFDNDIKHIKKAIITPQESLDSLRVVDGIERSLEEGKEVDLKEHLSCRRQ